MPSNGFRRIFRLLCWEGAFALVYETWIGPTYVSALAGELGVKVGLLSFLTAVPWIGSAGQLLAIWALERSESVKKYTLVLASLARGLWGVPVLMAWLWGFRAYRDHQPFPADRWFLLTAVIACTAALFATSSGAAWMAWVKGLVPGGFRGRFFGVRLRYTMGALILAQLAGYFWVGWKPLGYHLGYGLLLLGALACALVSTGLLSLVPDAHRLQRGERPEGDSGKTGILGKAGFGSVWESLRERRFRNVLIFGSLFNGAIQFAGPFFPYYFTHDLKLSISTVIFWTTLTHLGWFLAAVTWGKAIDRSRGPRLSFWVAAHAIALSPLFYVFPSVAWARWIGPFDYFTNGIAWAGYNLVFTTLLMEACPKRNSGISFSVYSASSGLFGALANLAGAQLAIRLTPWGGFRALWVLATVLRLAVIWWGASLLNEKKSMGKGRWRAATSDREASIPTIAEPA